jgi:hypothetical protein
MKSTRPIAILRDYVNLNSITDGYLVAIEGLFISTKKRDLIVANIREENSIEGTYTIPISRWRDYTPPNRAVYDQRHLVIPERGARTFIDVADTGKATQVPTLDTTLEKLKGGTSEKKIRRIIEELYPAYRYAIR